MSAVRQRPPDISYDPRSQRPLGFQLASDFAEGQEPQLAASVVSTCSGVVLICWEHDHIPALASSRLGQIPQQLLWPWRMM